MARELFENILFETGKTDHFRSELSLSVVFVSMKFYTAIVRPLEYSISRIFVVNKLDEQHSYFFLSITYTKTILYFFVYDKVFSWFMWSLFIIDKNSGKDLSWVFFFRSISSIFELQANILLFRTPEFFKSYFGISSKRLFLIMIILKYKTKKLKIGVIPTLIIMIKIYWHYSFLVMRARWFQTIIASTLVVKQCEKRKV